MLLYVSFVFLHNSSIHRLLYTNLKFKVIVFQTKGGRGSHIVGLQEWKVVFLGYICFSYVFLSIRYRNYVTSDTNTTQKSALFVNTFLHIICLALFTVKSDQRYRLSLFFCQSLMKLTENRGILFYSYFITYSPFRNRIFNICRTSRDFSLRGVQIFQLLISVSLS